MKKLFLAAFAVFAFASVSAQNFAAGVTVGLPVGDAGDAYTLNLGIDLSYLWEVSESFDAGIATGYNTSLGDEIDLGLLGSVDIDDFNYIPIAAAGRFNASEEFVLGLDLGYAIGTGDADGGFYYKPMVGYNVTEKVQTTISYRGISVDDGNFSTLNLGVNYGF